MLDRPTLLNALAALAVLATAPQALAADPVSFTMKASMPSLRDPANKDTFTVGLADKQVDTSLKISCQAAQASFQDRRNPAPSRAMAHLSIQPMGRSCRARSIPAAGW